MCTLPFHVPPLAQPPSEELPVCLNRTTYELGFHQRYWMTSDGRGCMRAWIRIMPCTESSHPRVHRIVDP